MAPTPRKDTASLLAKSREALATIGTRLAQLTKEREAALLGDDDRRVAALDQQIVEAEALARRERDRVELLSAVAAREEAERQAKRRAALIERAEAKLAEADDGAVEATKHIANAVTAVERVIALREEVAVAWPFDLNAQRPAALTGAAIMELVAFELYRLGARPFRGGNPLEKPRPSFPGGRAPTLQFAGQPEKITPLPDALRAASRYASSVMRGKTIALPPEPPAEAETTAAPAPAAPAAPAPAPAPTTRTAAEIMATIPKRQLTF